MPYYLVDVIGDGTINNKFRPDVDEGVSFRCAYGIDGKAVVLTDKPLSPKSSRTPIPPVDQLKNACEARGIDYNVVMNKWVSKGGG